MLTPMELSGMVNDPSVDSYDYNVTHVAEVCSDPIDTYRTNAAGEKVDLTAASITSFCESCVFPLDGKVNPTTAFRLVTANIAAMGLFVGLPVPRSACSFCADSVFAYSALSVCRTRLL